MAYEHNHNPYMYVHHIRAAIMETKLYHNIFFSATTHAEKLVK